jgi:hypothetical protein
VSSDEKLNRRKQTTKKYEGRVVNEEDNSDENYANGLKKKDEKVTGRAAKDRLKVDVDERSEEVASESLTLSSPRQPQAFYIGHFPHKSSHHSRRVSVGDMWLAPENASKRLAQQEKNHMIVIEESSEECKDGDTIEQPQQDTLFQRARQTWREITWATGVFSSHNSVAAVEDLSNARSRSLTPHRFYAHSKCRARML